MGVIRLHLAGGRMILVLVLNANLNLQEQSNNHLTVENLRYLEIPVEDLEE